MNENTIKVIEALTEDVLTLSRLILEDDSISTNKKVRKNTLKESALKKDIKTEIKSLESPVIINALFDSYINYIEWNRPKEYGKQPPTDELRDWALSRGIPTDNSTLFLIARAIWRDGHEGRPIIATLEKEIEENFDKEIYDKLFNSIIEEITKYFN
nr:MAG TPA: hypothetical protein [Caudoviricetes sp.]